MRVSSGGETRSTRDAVELADRHQQDVRAKIATVIELLKDVPKPIAYVLGGGGAWGSVHVGQLRALAKTDLRPDFVVGTSVGALNATIVAETPEIAHDRLAAFWSLVTTDEVFGSKRQMMMNMAALRPAIADPTPLRELLLRSTPSRDFADLQLPLTAVAADVTTGHHVELNSGDLISAMMASAAIPGMFPVVERDGLRLVDGGILYNVPISIAAEQGAQTIVVLDCGFNLFAPRTDPTFPHSLLRAVAIMASAQVRRDLTLYTDRTIIYVPGNWPPSQTPYDFTHSNENASESFEIAMDWLEGLTIDGKGLYGAPPDVTRVGS